tara:strand:+ start:9665 stop:10957 length:1293 start_codon:yes stop_codon:yes gene_type:complete
MNASKRNTRLISAALTLTALAGTAAAQTQSGPIYVLEPPSISALNPRVHAVANNAAGVLMTTDTDPDAAFGYNKIIWTWEDGGLSGPDEWSVQNQTNSSGGYFAYELKNVIVTSHGGGGGMGSGKVRYEMLANTPGPVPGSTIFSTADAPPMFVSPEGGQYAGAFTFSASASNERRASGATAVDIDGDGLLDLAACSWTVDAAGSTGPQILQMDATSNFSRVRASSTLGDIRVGDRGRIDRSASIDFSPEEDSLQAALWIGDQLADTSNLDTYQSSSFFDVCDDGSTALLHVTDTGGSSSILAYDTLTHTGRVLDASGGAVHAISSDGATVVGSTIDASGLVRAAFWTRAADGDYALHDFAAFIDNLGSSGLDGVSFLELTAVSADGLTVAGTMSLADGSLRAFTAAVPTPGSAFLIVAAGVLAARRRRA